MGEFPPAREIARSPVIPGFHPDPSVCRHGEDYYLVNSSFEYAPAVPLLHSTDLREWTALGHVLSEPHQFAGGVARPSGGIYAPTLRVHDERFWMITTNVEDGGGQILVTADDPRGRWSPVVSIPDAIGIDPDLAWDERGRCWLSWSGERPAGRHGILQAQLDPESGALITAPAVIWRGTGGQHPEAPHLLRRGEHWYLLIAEGGTERGHCVTVARGPAPDGPFAACPHNPILTARSTDAPTQSTGHADLVQRGDGSWAMVYLGIRPRGSFPGWHVLGRETFAAELAWDDDGWPRVGAPIESRRTRVERESLDGASLPPSWISPDADPAQVLRSLAAGWQLVHAPGARPQTFAGRRQQHLYTVTRAQLVPVAGVAALEIRIDPFHAVTVQVDDGVLRAAARIGDGAFTLGEAAVRGPVTLEIRTCGFPDAPGSPSVGPDLILAGAAVDAGFLEVGRLDGRYLSTEVAGGFTGRVIGVSSDGRADIESFTYAGSDDAAALPELTG